MECCINLTTADDHVIVHLAGHLRGVQVPDLLQVCHEHAAQGLRLDLSDLLNADAVGIDALRRLGRDGVSFQGLSEYLRLKLTHT